MIGRRNEIDELNKAYESAESEFVAVYGRRRVGKTYLIREVFEDRFVFAHSGVADSGMRRQLDRFGKSLQEYGYEGHRRLPDWDAAFDALKEVILASREVRKVVFLDELPWMDTPRSGFLSALESFWNGWASSRKDVLLIVCGSAASWMVKNLFRNKGGLHNRVTSRISLMPFTLSDCAAFAEERGLGMSRNDIAEAYMALGGIPYYWKYLDRRYSLSQNFDRIFFAPGAPLRGEYGELYSSLFGKAAIYQRIVEVLAHRKIGMTLAELSEALKLKASGSVSGALETLESSGFIRHYRVLGKSKKGTVYQLTDEFTLFHHEFLADGKTDDPDFWLTTSASTAHAAWRGLAFERLCLQHLQKLRSALGVAGVHVEAYAWRHQPDEVCPEGAQIDLLLDRADGTINLCEIKYSSEEYRLNERRWKEIATRVGVFKEVTGTRKSVHVTLITANGLARNAFSNRVQSVITLGDLF